MTNFATNHYDILYKMPELESDKMYVPLEKLARKMVARGLLRIGADERCNFVIFPFQNGLKHKSFSKRQLYNKRLLKSTKEVISQTIPQHELKHPGSVENKVELMRKMLDKYLEVPHEYEMKIARILVQTIHPVIMANLIVEGVDFFVSFGQSVADLLDVRMWQSARHSQGLQSNSLDETAVFVSCGGNPFFDPKESNNEYDGEVALKRLMVVAAQEIAHYADIIKDAKGNNIGRFSCTVNMTRPQPQCEDARQKDLQKTSEIEKIFLNLKLLKLYDYERRVKITKKLNKYSIRYFFMIIIKWFKQENFTYRCLRTELDFVKSFRGDEFLGETILKLCGDMKFNLEPKSEAYRNPNKNVEKAIACAEALARVPQQEVKWGTKITKIFMPNLYDYFYDNIIPEEEQFFRAQTGRDFKINMVKARKKLFRIK